MSYFSGLMRQTGLGVPVTPRTQTPGLEVEATELAAPVETSQDVPAAKAALRQVLPASSAARAETIEAKIKRSPESREEAVPARTAMAQTAASMEISRPAAIRMHQHEPGAPVGSHERAIELATPPTLEPDGVAKPQRAAMRAPEAETPARTEQVTFADVRAWVAAEPAEEPEPMWARLQAGSSVAAPERGAQSRNIADESYSLEIGKIEIVMEAPAAAPAAAPVTPPAPDYSWTLASRHYFR